MNIGALAASSGVSAKNIRHYESIGLLPQAVRSRGGYRTYDASDVHTMRFIRCARNAGFSIEEIRQMLALWQDREMSQAEVRRREAEYVRQIHEKLADARALKKAFTRLVRGHRDHGRPNLPERAGEHTEPAPRKVVGGPKEPHHA